MRTTLTLDDDVARLIDDAVRRDGRPMEQVVNDAIRRGLTRSQTRRSAPYKLVPHTSRVRPGFDQTGCNRLADELEDAQIVSSASRDDG